MRTALARTVFAVFVLAALGSSAALACLAAEDLAMVYVGTFETRSETVLPGPDRVVGYGWLLGFCVALKVEIGP